jgi:hypothetical protein
MISLPLFWSCYVLQSHAAIYRVLLLVGNITNQKGDSTNKDISDSPFGEFGMSFLSGASKKNVFSS